MAPRVRHLLSTVNLNEEFGKWVTLDFLIFSVADFSESLFVLQARLTFSVVDSYPVAGLAVDFWVTVFAAQILSRVAAVWKTEG